MIARRRVLFCFVVCLAIASDLIAQEPVAPESHLPLATNLEFKILKIFPAKNGLLTGRFKLANASSDIIKVWGRPSSMMEIIGLSPNQDIDAYATYVRLNEAENNDWISIPKPPNATPIKSQEYELFPGEIRYLDLALPNAKNKPKAELMVQLYLQIGEDQAHVNSPTFNLKNLQ